MKKIYEHFTVPAYDASVIYSTNMFRNKNHCDPNTELDFLKDEDFYTLIGNVCNLIRTEGWPNKEPVLNISIDQVSREVGLIFTDNYDYGKAIKTWMRNEDYGNMSVNEQEQVVDQMLQSLETKVLDTMGGSFDDRFSDIDTERMFENMRACSDVSFEIFDSTIPLQKDQIKRIKSIKEDEIPTYLVDVHQNELIKVTPRNVEEIISKYTKPTKEYHITILSDHRFKSSFKKNGYGSVVYDIFDKKIPELEKDDKNIILDLPVNLFSVDVFDEIISHMQKKPKIHLWMSKYHSEVYDKNGCIADLLKAANTVIYADCGIEIDEWVKMTSEMEATKALKKVSYVIDKRLAAESDVVFEVVQDNEKNKHQQKRIMDAMLNHRNVYVLNPMTNETISFNKL